MPREHDDEKYIGWVKPKTAIDLAEEIIDVAGKRPMRDYELMILAHTLIHKEVLMQAVVDRARFTLVEQRREFARGDIGDLDDLEDALNALDNSKT